MGETIKDPYSIENFSPGTVVCVQPGNRRTNEHFYALVLSTRETPNGTPPTSVIVSKLGLCSDKRFFNLPYLYFSKVSKLSLGAGTRANQDNCYFFNPENNRFVLIKAGERVKRCLPYGLWGKICYSTPAHRSYIPLHCKDDCGTYNLRLNF